MTRFQIEPVPGHLNTYLVSQRAGNRGHCRLTVAEYAEQTDAFLVYESGDRYSLVVVIIRRLSYQRKVSGAIRTPRNRWRKDAGVGEWKGGRRMEKEKEGERALTVVEVGQEVTGFVRIFAQAGRNARIEIALSPRRTRSSTFDTSFNISIVCWNLYNSIISVSLSIWPESQFV